MSTMKNAPRLEPARQQEWKPMTPFEFWLVVGTVSAVITIATLNALMVRPE